MITEKEFERKTDQPTKSHLHFPEMPFVGRVSEFQKVDQRLVKARHSEGGIVFLSGEAGIGKTRFANEIIRLAKQKEYRCLFAKCRGDIGSPLYYPWMELVRKFSEQASAHLFFKVCGAYTDQIVRLVPELFESSHPEASNPDADVLFEKGNVKRGASAADNPAAFSSASARAKTPEEIQLQEIQFFHSLTHLFVRLSQEAPLLLVLDDLQWCDAASLRVINYFATSSLAKNRILLLCLYRDIDLQGDPSPAVANFVLGLEQQRKEISCSLIRLERLSHDDVARLLDEIFHKKNPERSSTCPKDFSQSLYYRTGGNPLFIGETLKSLVETEEISQNEHGMWTFGNKKIESFQLPETIRSVVEQRLGRLDEQTLKVLEVASTIGEQFNLESLKDVATFLGRENFALEAWLESASKSGVISVTRSASLSLSSSASSTNFVYSFSDEWVRDLLYEKLTPAERQLYHLAVAKSIESRFVDQGDVTSNEHYSELANHYLNGGELAKAQAYYVMSAQRAARLFAHQESYSRFKTALDLFGQMVTSGGFGRNDDLLRAEILKSMGDEAQFLPQYLKTFECWKKAADIYEKHGAWLKAADVYSKLGMAYHIVLYELEESEAALKRAVELAKRDAKTPSIELARLTAFAMIADIWRSDVQKVKEKSAIAMKLAEESGA
ncbi:MAG: AAA family ATPase, partial [Nitrososphaerota archaeon]|nr:AAA family ATPase [Nitrososphaerota archaeon]